ncbi:MAG: hypothetical protein IT552_11740 [Sphingomonadaceae bacterium]|nr:hypothetical protein [Sphingomonadaceae bacterium]
MKIHLNTAALLPLTLALAACNGGSTASSPEMPPMNPFLIDSELATTHYGPAQQDSLPFEGPIGIHELDESQIQRVGGGMVNIAILQGPKYESGEEVIIAANNNQVAKILVNDGKYELIAATPIDGQPHMSGEDADKLAAQIDAAGTEQEVLEILNKDYSRYVEQVVARAAIYNISDKDGNFYTVVNNDVVVFADEEPGNPRSAMVEKNRFRLPAEYFSPTLEDPDAVFGLGMTYDGNLVMVTMGGVVAVVDREFKNDPIIHRLADEEQVTNSIAIDKDGGIYVLSNKKMHKMVWDGSQLYTDSNGAWSCEYDSFEGKLGGVSLGNGSGSTPSLMGFGDEEDKLIVITDGSLVMNMVAFWRDEIPEGFEQKPGTKSRRIADQIKVSFGKDNLDRAQSEQSVAVYGYGALVVNNTLPTPLPTMLENVVTSGFTREGPTGAEKFEWDSKNDRWTRAWANPDVASPSTVPMISGGSNQVYVNGFVDGKWEITGLDWDTGEVATRLRMGKSQKYNGAYSVIAMLPGGDIVLGGLFGTMRIRTEENEQGQ